MSSKSIRVKCTTTNQTFDSLRQAERLTRVPVSNIRRVLRGEAQFAGKDEDGNKLHWELIEKNKE